MLTRQVATLARRSIVTTLRQPGLLVPNILFPLLFLALMTAGAGRAADVPGFPADSYLDFMLAGVIVQGTLLGGINAGSTLAVDVEEGFISRLLLTPMRRTALLVGHLSGAMAVGAFQAIVILGVGIVAGVRLEAGLAGALVIVVLSVFVALAFSAVGALIAVRTGSAEATQSFFPLFFILFIFSSFFMPRDFIGVAWFKAIATYNPASYMIEAIRSLVVTGWDAGALTLGLAAMGGIALVGITGAATALRTQLARA